jgi:hypothetical protein
MRMALVLPGLHPSLQKKKKKNTTSRYCSSQQ